MSKDEIYFISNDNPSSDNYIPSTHVNKKQKTSGKSPRLSLSVENFNDQYIKSAQKNG